MQIPATKGALTPATLKMAGILALISAMSTLPMFMLSLLLADRHDETTRSIQIVMQCMGTSIFMALAATLRCYLVRNCAFSRADAIIFCLMLLNIVYAVVSCVGLFMPDGAKQLQSIIPALVILIGIAQAGLGMRLFSLDSDLGGMKRQYCWLNIVTGVCLASLLLVVIGIVASAVADVMLGTIFIQEAKRLSSPKVTDSIA